MTFTVTIGYWLIPVIITAIIWGIMAFVNPTGFLDRRGLGLVSVGLSGIVGAIMFWAGAILTGITWLVYFATFLF